MRARRSSLLVTSALLALFVAGPAAADRTAKPGDKPKPIDIKPAVDKLDVYRDDAGMYYTSPRAGAFADNAGDWVFYGDGKTMYRQRTVGFGFSPDRGYDWTVWSPRVRQIQNASFSPTRDKPSVSCTQKDKKALTLLSADEAKVLLGRAKFLPPLWQRQAHFLARDDDGTYFFVDRFQDDFGGKGHRIFSGQKGAMKELSMTNVVSDSAGEIYATKSGDLKIVTEGSAGKAYWKKGQAKNELIVLDLFANRYLIYRELGIYGQLGIICDDQ